MNSEISGATGRSLVDIFRDSPCDVAGMADFRRSDDLLCYCASQVAALIERDESEPVNFLPDHDLANILFVLLMVAQRDYDDGELWPFVRQLLGMPLPQKHQDRLGEWFRKGLRRFGYQFSDDRGQSNLMPILMHTLPRKSLPGLLRLVVRRIEVCGTEPDPDELRDVVETWRDPGLHANVARLLKSGWQGAVEMWASLAEVVLAWPDAARVNDALGSVPSIIDGDVVRQTLQELNHPSGTLRESTLYPQIRYDPRYGAVHLWIPNGTPREWTVSPEVEICWDPSESGWVGEFWDPIPEQLTFQRADDATAKRVVATTFSSDECPATLWFRGGNGVLLPSERVRHYGIEEGSWYVVCRPESEPPFPAQARRPLNSRWAGWSAWEVDVLPDVSQSKPENRTWKFPPSRPTMSVPLALRPGPRLQLVCRDDPTQEVQSIVASAFFRHERIPVYAAMPSVVLKRRQTCRLLIRRWDGSRFVAKDRKQLMAETPVALDNEPGIYQFRETGSLRSVHQFAVIPGLAADGPTYSPDGERVAIHLRVGADTGFFVPAGDARTATSVERLSPTEWRLGASTVRPAASVGWLWRGEEQSALDLLMEWPIFGLRWRIKLLDETTRWTRDVVSLDERSENAQLEIQVPPRGELLINDEPVQAMQPCPAGRYIRRPLAAYSHRIRLTYEDRHLIAVAFIRRPTLDELLAASEDDWLAVQWVGDCPEGTNLMIWDPLHPQQPPVTVSLDATTGGREERHIPWANIPFAPLVAVTLVKEEGGLGEPRYECAVRRSSPTKPFGVVCRRPGANLDAATEVLAQAALDWQLALLVNRFDDDVLKALRKNLLDSEATHGPIPWDRVGELAQQLTSDKGLLLHTNSGLRDRISDALRRFANTRLDWLPILRSLGDDATSRAGQRFLECLEDGIHLGWIKPHRLAALGSDVVAALPCPLGYYRSVWFLRTNFTEALEQVDSGVITSFAQYRQMQLEAADITWAFHEKYALPSLEKTSPWRRDGGLVPMTKTDQQPLRFIPPPKPEEWNRKRFYEELGIETLCRDAESVLGQGSRHEQTLLTWEGRKNRGWTVERSSKLIGHAPYAKPGLQPVLMDAWRQETILEELSLRGLLIRWGRECTARATVPPLKEVEEIDAALKDDCFTGIIHRRLLQPEPIAERSLWGGSFQRPEDPDVPDVPLTAWRLAWLDRLTVWRGQDYLLAPEGRTSLTAAAFQTTLVSALRAWPRLMTQCLALAEFLYVVLALGGLGIAAKFKVPNDG